MSHENLMFKGGTYISKEQKEKIKKMNRIMLKVIMQPKLEQDLETGERKYYIYNLETGLKQYVMTGDPVHQTINTENSTNYKLVLNPNNIYMSLEIYPYNL